MTTRRRAAVADFPTGVLYVSPLPLVLPNTRKGAAKHPKI